MSKTLLPLQSRLSDAALLYLGRYEASVQSLRRVLKRRIERWARVEQWEIDEDAAGLVEAVIARLRQSGAVDDGRYADGKVAALRRDGRSGRAIRAYLAARGVAPGLIEATLASDPDDSDLAAALRLAQKRRLGRYRPEQQRAERRDRDLAALGRAGFSWEIARRVVDGED